MLSARETNRLHRWAMWRMTVNEGIISCMRPDNNLPRRVNSPDAHPDEITTSPVQELPFLGDEQFQLARRLNLREKYGSIPGLSDDAYFIFGLPRISVGNDVPEVTSTGTRSVYGSNSDFGAIDFNGSRMEPNANFHSAYSEPFGPTPDERSLASNNDFEVERINGYTTDWRNLASPGVPRLNLYSIREENNNERERIDTYPFNVSPSRSETYLPTPSSPNRHEGAGRSYVSDRDGLASRGYTRRGCDFHPHSSPSPPHRSTQVDYHRGANSSQAPPLPKRSHSPSPGPPRGWGGGYSPYMHRSRPMMYMSDEHIERSKREAYYDWDEGMRMAEKYTPEFVSPHHHRYS